MKIDTRNNSTAIFAPSESNTFSFPLRRLPYVALQEVLKHLDLIEQIELSLCSKKCIQLVKIARRNKRLHLRLVGIQDLCLMMCVENEVFKSCSLYTYEKNHHEIGINLQFYLRANDNKELGNGMDLHDGMINGHKIKYHRGEDNKLNTYWEDRTTGKMEIFKYITDLFQYPRIDKAYIVERIPIRPLYDWIAQKYGGRIDEWNIFGDNRNQEDVKYLTEMCRKGKKVVYTEFNQQNRFDLNFDTDQLCLNFVKWLNLNDLIKLSNQSVILKFDSTSLTNEGVNGFLKNWVTTTHSTKMRFLFMHAGNKYDYDIDVILTGIEYKARDALPDHPFKEVDYFHSFRTKTGFTIQRNNGELASIFFSLDYSTSFEMLIH